MLCRGRGGLLACTRPQDRVHGDSNGPVHLDGLVWVGSGCLVFGERPCRVHLDERDEFHDAPGAGLLPENDCLCVAGSAGHTGRAAGRIQGPKGDGTLELGFGKDGLLPEVLSGRLQAGKVEGVEGEAGRSGEKDNELVFVVYGPGLSGGLLGQRRGLGALRAPLQASEYQGGYHHPTSVARRLGGIIPAWAPRFLAEQRRTGWGWVLRG
jgi:hypothetical protein